MLIKNNSQLIIPLIIHNRAIINSNVVESDVELVLDNMYVLLKYNNVFFPYKDIKNEPNFYNMYKTKTGFIVRFLVPRDKFCICNLLYKTGSTYLPTDAFNHTLTYWLHKTPAARESSRGLFLFF